MAKEDFDTLVNRYHSPIGRIIPLTKPKRYVRKIHHCKLCKELIGGRKTYCVTHSLEQAEARRRIVNKESYLRRKK